MFIENDTCTPLSHLADYHKGTGSSPLQTKSLFHRPDAGLFVLYVYDFPVAAHAMTPKS